MTFDQIVDELADCGPWVIHNWGIRHHETKDCNGHLACPLNVLCMERDGKVRSNGHLETFSSILEMKYADVVEFIDAADLETNSDLQHQLLEKLKPEKV
jgi:hypothetical protein